MEVKATLRQLRIAPQKVRVVADQVRGLTVVDAQKKLEGMTRGAAIPVLKLILSATANAEHNNNLQKDQLYIKTIQVDEGVTLKRWLPRAFGRATTLRKRASHIAVILDLKKGAKVAARAVKKPQPKKKVATNENK